MRSCDKCREEMKELLKNTVIIIYKCQKCGNQLRIEK